MYDWVIDEIKKELAKPEQEEPLRVADAIELNVATKVERLFAANELRRLHDENETLKKCLFQMQNAAIELNKPNQFYPDWDTLKPYHERIAELEAQLAQPEQEPVAWLYQHKKHKTIFEIKNYRRPDFDSEYIDEISLYTSPPRKPWVGLTSEDWENTPDTGKQGCERDAELFDWIEKTLKDKNDTL
jgi:hypothetical protein